ncbi:class A beta-lactamase [Phenylobacterium sp.]|jgi:beta-lactamase class A|uniref:class A beta-lactamase n=1 Tax=Phenylobacterium sp. TaxID=1871053 RepID=UPI002F95D1A3
MRPFQTPDGMGASLGRRRLITGGGAALLLGACGDGERLTAATTPALDVERLAKEVPKLAERARPGLLGFGLMNLDSGQHWTLNGDRPFPMQSVFKAPLGAFALAEAEAGRLRPEEVVAIRDVDLAPGHSPIADAWPVRRDYTVRELIAAAVSDSDNTAADVLMARVGGPGALTAWLQARRIVEVRVDRYERELQPEAYGMAPFRAEWKGPTFAIARDAVPQERRLAAMRAYMADPRDTATPRGMLDFLSLLDASRLLSPAGTRQLVRLMLDTPRGADRIRAGLPGDWRFAHKIGTSGVHLGLSLAFNDVGVASLPGEARRSYAVAAFLSGTTLDLPSQATLFADIGRLVARSVG